MGRIPFDTDVAEAINNGKTIVDIDCVSGKVLKVVYNKAMELLNKNLKQRS